MAVVIPASHANEQLTLIASKVTSLGAVSSTAAHANQSAQLKNQTEMELVMSLLDARKLQAATIISTLPASRQTNPLYAAITIVKAQVASLSGAALAGQMAANSLDQLQRQLVHEEMASGARTGASILAGMSYIGN